MNFLQQRAISNAFNSRHHCVARQIVHSGQQFSHSSSQSQPVVSATWSGGAPELEEGGGLLRDQNSAVDPHVAYIDRRVRFSGGVWPLVIEMRSLGQKKNINWKQQCLEGRRSTVAGNALGTFRQKCPEWCRQFNLYLASAAPNLFRFFKVDP